MAPRLSSEGRAPSVHTSKRNEAPSPGYFGFVVGGDDSIPPDSNPGNHTKQNWDFPSSQARSVAEKAQQKSVESNPDYAEFRRQSEHHARFQLKGHTLSSMTRPSQSRQGSKSSVQQKRPSAETPLSPSSKGGFFDSMQIDDDGRSPKQDQKSFFDIPRENSPGPMSPHLSNVADHQHARLSLPGSRLMSPPVQERTPQRAETLPLNTTEGQPTMITAQQLSDLLASMPEKVLVLDLRVYPQYASARVKGALNLCIPTTLLKRPSFTVQKLLDTFNTDQEREEFEKWDDCPYIVVYDANSMQLKEAMTSQNVLKKFVTEGWRGHGLIVTGGFLQISRTMPNLVEDGSVVSTNGAGKQVLAANSLNHDTIAVAGGCSMPSEKGGPANAFFGNIRQNMDLLDGVGQLPVRKPENMTDRTKEHLPAWLKRASSVSNEGKLVSDKFLAIEKAEQKRMQEALSGHVSYGSPASERPKRIQIAGIEKGSKNRYNNIFPYDHTRVRLQGVPEGDCDYINANAIRTSYSNRRYIATQAPVPSTFDDFWRLTWEQDIRVIVMLTAEQEGGQVKSHPYWNAGSYGPLKLKVLSEKRVSLEPRTTSHSSSSSVSSSTKSPPDHHRPSLGPRRSTQPDSASQKTSAENAGPSASDPPAVIVRHLTLSHSAFPFQPMREITQLQYTQWPDFGAPAVPTAILNLVEQVNKYIRPGTQDRSSSHAAEPGQRPIIVHCSAGCGRTGTFCAIDSVIDMLKHQRDAQQRGVDEMDIDEEDDWVNRDDIDLVAMVVEEMRKQRLSMVQNLRQFVLCYESVMGWIAEQQQKGQGHDSKDENKKGQEKRPAMSGRSKTGTHPEKEKDKARPSLHGNRKSYYG
jgi:protein tyrosine phosphatase/rhodanese-related sulfurtransferase